MNFSSNFSDNISETISTIGYRTEGAPIQNGGGLYDTIKNFLTGNDRPESEYNDVCEKINGIKSEVMGRKMSAESKSKVVACLNELLLSINMIQPSQPTLQSLPAPQVSTNMVNIVPPTKLTPEQEKANAQNVAIYQKAGFLNLTNLAEMLGLKPEVSEAHSETSTVAGLTATEFRPRESLTETSYAPSGIQNMAFSETSMLSATSPLMAHDSVFMKRESNNIKGVVSAMTNTTTPRGLTDMSATHKGGNQNNFGELLNTSEFIDGLVKIYGDSKNITGGAMNGVRSLNTYSDYQWGGDNDSVGSRGNNQATELHDETVRKIMNMLGVSEDQARVYKAYVYSEVKNRFPELNNLDRAKKMSEMADDIDFLRNINVSELESLSERMQKHRAEKQKMRKESSSMMDLTSPTSEAPKKKKKASTKKESSKKSTKKSTAKKSKK